MDNSHAQFTTRRDFMKLGVASAVTGVAASLPLATSAVHAAETTADLGARFLLDCHVHVGGSPALAALIDQVHTPKGWLALRGKQPESFAKAASQSQVDNSESLIATMDKHGVSHAIIQATPGKDACMVIAKRNANVYFDLTDSRAEHLREAIDEIGANRIMFGSDLHGLSLNYAHDVGFEIVEGAQPSEGEKEWIAWRTADMVYGLGLEG